MDQSWASFLEIWRQLVFVLAGACLVLAIILRLVHSIKASSIKDPKEKYDYLKQNELKYYWRAALLVTIGLFLFLNGLDNKTVQQSWVWFIIRLFVGGAIGTLLGYISYLVIKFYQPGRLQVKLDKLRYLPRISSQGNKMKLLSEEEEDVYLDEGMQAEENIFSVDYDVWVDDQSGEIKIEKYPGYFEVLKCGSCGFQTLKLHTEEIIKEPTETEEGELLKNYKCTYCSSKRTTQHVIGKKLKSEKDFKLPERVILQGEKEVGVKSIKIEVVFDRGERREFVFQNLDEASKFLYEFEADKVMD